MSIAPYSEKAFLAAGMRDKKERILVCMPDELWKPVVPHDCYGSTRSAAAVASTAALTIDMPTEIAAHLFRISNGSDANLHALATAAAGLLIYKYSGLEEFLVGIPSTFVRVSLLNTMSFKDLLVETRQWLDSANHYKDYPLEVLANELGLPWQHDDNPFFDIAVMLTDIHDSVWMQEIPCPFVFAMSRHSDGIKLTLHYQTSLYNEATAHQLTNHYINLIGNAIEHPYETIANIQMMQPEELVQQRPAPIREMNDLVHPTVLHRMVEAQANANPEHIALNCGDEQVTYRELNEKANRIAEVLRRKGVDRETIVAIIIERSNEMVAGILGILKAGGAYLPIEPSLPEERIRFMLDDARARFLLTSNSVDVVSRLRVQQVVCFEDIEDRPLAAEVENVAVPDDAAYIIYTSGTSGKPKGTVIQHSHITSLLQHTLPLFSFTNSDRWALFHSFSFDFSVWEMFGALTTGATLIIVPEQIVKNTKKFLGLLHEQGVTVLNQTPSAFYELIRQEKTRGEVDSSLRCVIFGGEALNPAKLAEWAGKHPDIQLVNMYGITETTVHVTYKRLQPEDLHSTVSNIGYLLPHLQAIVLDKDLNPVSKGVPGELWISGEAVARGYLHKPEMTSQRFLVHPLFGETRFYRSGDLVRVIADGELEYLGRMDQQVKVRGYRIETGEIERTLRLHSDIDDAVVLLQTDSLGNKELASYVVLRAPLTVKEVRTFLEASLPLYMIPAYFYEIDAIPLTINGKLDRQALTIDNRKLLSEALFQMPETAMEWLVYRIWKKYMPIENDYGIRDHMFQFGGNSLIASSMINELNHELKTDFPLRTIYENPTIQSLSSYVSGQLEPVYESIPVVEAKEWYPCSFAQERMYLNNGLAGNSTLYNMPVMLELNGLLEPDKFKQAIGNLVQRHCVLRTSFDVVDGRPVQRLMTEIGMDSCVEILTLNPQHLESYISDFVQPFQLNSAPLFRLKLISLAEDKHVLLFDLHHIIADGISLEILLQDLLSLYEGASLAPIAVQYHDYAEWQQQLPFTEQMAKHETYWLEQFREEAPLLALPYDFAKTAEMDIAGDVYASFGDEKLLRDLAEMAARQNTTFYTVLLAAYYVLLYKYSGQEDIVVGTPVEGRDHYEVKRMAGVFVNTVALRCRPSGGRTFLQFLEEIKEQLLLSLDHQRYPFEKLVSKLQLSRNLSNNPLFDTWFSLQTIPHVSSVPFAIKTKPISAGVSKFDISLYAEINGDNLSFVWEYRTKLFTRETIVRMSAHFFQVLKEIVTEPTRKLDELGMLTEEGKHLILHSFNNTSLDYRRDQSVQGCFERMVELYANETAILTTRRTCTYRELNRRANRLARTLRRLGVDRHTVVGVMQDRTPDLIVSLLAVLKSGAAYLPIDRNYPSDRINHMLLNSQVRLLLVEQEQAHFVSSLSYAGDVLYVKDDEMSDGDDANLEDATKPQDLAYVLYTSGSTGSPKGVKIHHGNVLNFIHGMSDKIKFQPGKTMLALTTISFDIFFVETLMALCCGMKVLLADVLQQTDPELVSAFLDVSPIHTLQLTPSRLSMFLENRHGRHILEQAEQILVGGEQFPLQLLKELQRAAKGQIYNLYGPTETTIWSTVQNVTTSNRNDIGRPLANTTMYVTDHNQRLMPVGVPGELYIAGAGVSTGYFANEELTRQRFIPDPFTGQGYMYRTGDLVKWLDDGCLMYLGRLDNQIKIRGYRIDTEEVEEAMVSYPGVTNAVVVAQQMEARGQTLIGYYSAEKPSNNRDLRSFLMEKLPVYMVPSLFVHLDKFPLTPNGKINRKKLPHITEPKQGSETTGIAPRNDTERQMAAIWAKELAVGSDIGIDENFFELGGNSMQANAILIQIQSHWGAELSLRQFFVRPTISALSAQVEAAEKTKALVIPVAATAEYYPLSSAQSRIYFLYELEGQGISYNMPFVVRVKGTIDLERLVRAVQKVVMRHESLRTSFELVNGQPVQRVRDNVDIPVSVVRPKSPAELDDIIFSFVKPFSLDTLPLLRLSVVDLGSDQSVFMLDMHHIVCDGVSTEIFIEDLLHFYHAGSPVSAERITYKDYSVWQNAFSNSELYKSQEAYWLQSLAGELPILQLPADFPRTAIKDYKGSTIRIRVEDSLRTKLQRLAADAEVTLNMVLLSAYYALLFRYTGQQDIIVGTPSANRRQAETRRIIGMFVNTLALRSYPDAGKSARQFMNEVKDLVTRAFEHQEYPFEDLIDKLNLPRDMSRNPIFDTMFSFQSKKNQQWNSGHFVVEPYPFDAPVSKFDLTLNALETIEELYLELEFSTDLFLPETMHRMMTHYVRMLEAFTDNPNCELGGIDFLTVIEKRQLLDSFNRTLHENTKEDSFYSLFERVVRQYPNRTAVVFGNESVTYEELEKKASQLALALYSDGARRNSKVGILVNRSVEMIVAVLAVLKTGAAYVPIDPAYPSERILHMLKDCEADLLLHQDDTPENVRSVCKGINIDNPVLFSGDGLQHRIPNQPEDLLYIAYTSGSTGKPKGVMIQHYQFLNMCAVWRQEYSLHTPDFSLMQLASISFDVFSGDLGRTLLHGGKLVVCSDEEKYDFQRLYRLMEENRISLFESTAALIVPFMNFIFKNRLEISFLRLLIIGSDVCRVEDFRNLCEMFEGRLRIINSYGVTEATVDSSYFEMNPETEWPISTVPIGRPLPSVRFYILDERKQLVPIGVAGELYIGGGSVGLGYYGNAELTEQKFLPDPFLPNARMYRTGDHARWLANGMVEFLGRLDDQIKIRGRRIETGEIENCLRKHPLVQKTVVVARKDNNREPFLCAYYTSDVSIDSIELRHYASAFLPDFMIPSYFVKLDKMPLNANGKIDKNRFPAPEILMPNINVQHVQPETEMERKLTNIWMNVLSKEEIGIDDDFFVLGGNSMDILQLNYRIKKELSLDFNVTTLFRYPTIRSFLRQLQMNDDKPAIAADQAAMIREGNNRKKEILQRRRNH